MWTFIDLIWGLSYPAVFALGWVVCKVGVSGIIADIASLKTDVSNLKSEIIPTAKATPSATPAAA
jgi:hypothetical protein